MCAICLKRNHIARVCQSQVQPTPPQRPNKSSTQWTAKVRYVETEAVSSDERIYTLRSLSDHKHYHADVCLSTPGDSTKIVCKFQIDTGASCSILAFADYKCMIKSSLQPSHTKLKLYDNSILQPLGLVTLHCEVKGIRKKITFQLMDCNSPSLLSGQASPPLKLIVFNTECVRQLSEVKEGTDMWKAILEWCNATTPGMHSSPAQRFFSRHTRSMLPCKTTDYIPQVQAEIQSMLIRKRQMAKTYYDHHTKPLPDLTIGHTQIPDSNWESGRVIGKEAPSICRCLPPDTTWHKVKSPKAD